MKQRSLCLIHYYQTRTIPLPKLLSSQSLAKEDTYLSEVLLPHARFSMLSRVLLVASFLVAICKGAEGYLTNVALHKPTEISSIYSSMYGHSYRAVDGVSGPNYISYCFHTLADAHSWFRVDLESEFTVSSVVITNRGDCCGERLSNFRVLVSSEKREDPEASGNETICYDHEGSLRTDETKTLTCSSPLKGRFVTIVLMKRNFLHFCELKVMAESAGGNETRPEVTPESLQTVTPESLQTVTPESLQTVTPELLQTPTESESASGASSEPSGAGTAEAECTKVCDAPYMCILTKTGKQKCGCPKGPSGKECRKAAKGK